MIDATDDKLDDRLGSIVDATLLPHRRIVFAQECLIEVDDRILHLRPTTIVVEDLIDIAVEKYIDQIIDDMSESFIQIVIIEDIFEQPTDKRIGLRDQSTRFFTRECRQCRIIESRCEQSIGDSLSIHIGKLIRRQIMDEDIFK